MSPEDLIASTWGAHGSMTVTSTPALIMSAQSDAPTEPAPQNATLMIGFLTLVMTQGDFGQRGPVFIH